MSANYYCADIQLHEELGRGSFSTVRRGILSGSGQQIAVKITESHYNNVHQEIERMRRLNHPNIIKLIGTVLPNMHQQGCYCPNENMLNTWVLTEFMAVGNLLDFVNSYRGGIPAYGMIQMARQIAFGMDYLHRFANIVHRDLAARNILVKNYNFNVKISDFGIALDNAADVEVIVTDNEIRWPISYMPPETLPLRGNRRIFSAKSDLWSYGVVLFEIWSRGATPFGNSSYNEVLRRVNDGRNVLDFYYNLHARRWIRHLMNRCFEYQRQRRPTFLEILDIIDLDQNNYQTRLRMWFVLGCEFKL